MYVAENKSYKYRMLRNFLMDKVWIVAVQVLSCKLSERESNCRILYHWCYLSNNTNLSFKYFVLSVQSCIPTNFRNFPLNPVLLKVGFRTNAGIHAFDFLVFNITIYRRSPPRRYQPTNSEYFLVEEMHRLLASSCSWLILRYLSI